MELSSCPQCSAKRNIPLSFSFFLTNRFHLALSCSHCGARYVPTMLQRIVQLILLLAFSIGCGLLYTPLLRLEFTLSAVGTFRLLPLWVLVVLLVLALGALAPASRSAVEKAGKYSRVPPWTIGLFLYHFDCDFLSGNNADQLSICTGSPDESAVLISFSFAGGCYDISILSAAIAAEGAGNILG